MTYNQEELVEESEDTMRGRFLTFAIGQEVYGIEIRMVKEIIGLQPINRLPEVPDYIRGIINLRGLIIPVVDMRIKLRKEAIADTDRTCIIIIEAQQITAGLIVDHVADVLNIEEENISPPAVLGGFASRYISGIGKVDGKVKLLLDCEKLFTDEETELLDQASQS